MRSAKVQVEVDLKTKNVAKAGQDIRSELGAPVPIKLVFNKKQILRDLERSLPRDVQVNVAFRVQDVPVRVRLDADSEIESFKQQLERTVARTNTTAKAEVKSKVAIDASAFEAAFKRGIDAFGDKADEVGEAIAKKLKDTRVRAVSFGQTALGIAGRVAAAPFKLAGAVLTAPIKAAVAPFKLLGGVFGGLAKNLTAGALAGAGENIGKDIAAGLIGSVSSNLFGSAEFLGERVGIGFVTLFSTVQNKFSSQLNVLNRSLDQILDDKTRKQFTASTQKAIEGLKRSEDDLKKFPNQLQPLMATLFVTFNKAIDEIDVKPIFEIVGKKNKEINRVREQAKKAQEKGSGVVGGTFNQAFPEEERNVESAAKRAEAERRKQQAETVGRESLFRELTEKRRGIAERQVPANQALSAAIAEEQITKPQIEREQRRLRIRQRQFTEAKTDRETRREVLAEQLEITRLNLQDRFGPVIESISILRKQAETAKKDLEAQKLDLINQLKVAAPQQKSGLRSQIDGLDTQIDAQAQTIRTADQKNREIAESLDKQTRPIKNAIAVLDQGKDGDKITKTERQALELVALSIVDDLNDINKLQAKVQQQKATALAEIEKFENEKIDATEEFFTVSTPTLQREVVQRRVNKISKEKSTVDQQVADLEAQSIQASRIDELFQEEEEVGEELTPEQKTRNTKAEALIKKIEERIKALAKQTEDRRALLIQPEQGQQLSDDDRAFNQAVEDAVLTGEDRIGTLRERLEGVRSRIVQPGQGVLELSPNQKRLNDSLLDLGARYDEIIGLPLQQAQERQKELKAQLKEAKAELEGLPKPVPKQLREVTETLLGRQAKNSEIPNIIVDTAKVESKGAEAFFDPLDNAIFLTEELNEKLEKGELTFQQLRILSEEVAHNIQTGLGSAEGFEAFRGQEGDRQALTQVAADASNDEIAAVSRNLQQYHEGLRGIERDAKIAADRAAELLKQDELARAAVEKLYAQYGFAGSKLTTEVTSAFEKVTESVGLVKAFNSKKGLGIDEVIERFLVFAKDIAHEADQATIELAGLQREGTSKADVERVEAFVQERIELLRQLDQEATKLKGIAKLKNLEPNTDVSGVQFGSSTATDATDPTQNQVKGAISAEISSVQTLNVEVANIGRINVGGQEGNSETAMLTASVGELVNETQIQTRAIADNQKATAVADAAEPVVEVVEPDAAAVTEAESAEAQALNDESEAEIARLLEHMQAATQEEPATTTDNDDEDLDARFAALQEEMGQLTQATETNTAATDDAGIAAQLEALAQEVEQPPTAPPEPPQQTVVASAPDDAPDAAVAAVATVVAEELTGTAAEAEGVTGGLAVVRQRSGVLSTAMQATTSGVKALGKTLFAIAEFGEETAFSLLPGAAVLRKPIKKAIQTTAKNVAVPLAVSTAVTHVPGGAEAVQFITSGVTHAIQPFIGAQFDALATGVAGHINTAIPEAAKFLGDQVAGTGLRGAGFTGNAIGGLGTSVNTLLQPVLQPIVQQTTTLITSLGELTTTTTATGVAMLTTGKAIEVGAKTAGGKVVEVAIDTGQKVLQAGADKVGALAPSRQKALPSGDGQPLELSRQEIQLPITLTDQQVEFVGTQLERADQATKQVAQVASNLAEQTKKVVTPENARKAGEALRVAKDTSEAVVQNVVSKAGDVITLVSKKLPEGITLDDLNLDQLKHARQKLIDKLTSVADVEKRLAAGDESAGVPLNSSSVIRGDIGRVQEVIKRKFGVVSDDGGESDLTVDAVAVEVVADEGENAGKQSTDTRQKALDQINAIKVIFKKLKTQLDGSLDTTDINAAIEEVQGFRGTVANGRADLKAIIEQLKAAGVNLGNHSEEGKLIRSALATIDNIDAQVATRVKQLKAQASAPDALNSLQPVNIVGEVKALGKILGDLATRVIAVTTNEAADQAQAVEVELQTMVHRSTFQFEAIRDKFKRFNTVLGQDFDSKTAIDALEELSKIKFEIEGSKAVLLDITKDLKAQDVPFDKGTIEGQTLSQALETLSEVERKVNIRLKILHKQLTNPRASEDVLARFDAVDTQAGTRNNVRQGPRTSEQPIPNAKQPDTSALTQQSETAATQVQDTISNAGHALINIVEQFQELGRRVNDTANEQDTGKAIGQLRSVKRHIDQSKSAILDVAKQLQTVGVDLDGESEGGKILRSAIVAIADMDQEIDVRLRQLQTQANEAEVALNALTPIDISGKVKAVTERLNKTATKLVNQTFEVEGENFGDAASKAARSPKGRDIGVNIAGTSASIAAAHAGPVGGIAAELIATLVARQLLTGTSLAKEGQELQGSIAKLTDAFQKLQAIADNPQLRDQLGDDIFNDITGFVVGQLGSLVGSAALPGVPIPAGAVASAVITPKLDEIRQKFKGTDIATLDAEPVLAKKKDIDPDAAAAISKAEQQQRLSSRLQAVNDVISRAQRDTAFRGQVAQDLDIDPNDTVTLFQRLEHQRDALIAGNLSAIDSLIDGDEKLRTVLDQREQDRQAGLDELAAQIKEIEANIVDNLRRFNEAEAAINEADKKVQEQLRPDQTTFETGLIQDFADEGIDDLTPSLARQPRLDQLTQAPKPQAPEELDDTNLRDLRGKLSLLAAQPDIGNSIKLIREEVLTYVESLEGLSERGEAALNKLLEGTRDTLLRNREQLVESLRPQIEKVDELLDTGAFVPKFTELPQLRGLLEEQFDVLLNPNQINSDRLKEVRRQIDEIQTTAQIIDLPESDNDIKRFYLELVTTLETLKQQYIELESVVDKVDLIPNTDAVISDRQRRTLRNSDQDFAVKGDPRLTDQSQFLTKATPEQNIDMRVRIHPKSKKDAEKKALSTGGEIGRLIGKGLRQSSPLIDRAFKVLSNSSKDAADETRANVKDLFQEIRKEFQGIRQEAPLVGRSLNFVKQVAIGAFATFGVFQLSDALVDLGRKAFETTIQIGSLENTLRFTSGSDAARNLAFINQQVDELSLSLPATIESFSQLATAGQGTIFEGQAVRDVFADLTTVIRVYNRSAEEQTRITTQLSQGLARTKFELEDIKSVGEVIPIFPAIQDATGESVFEQTAAGNLTFDDVAAGLDLLAQKAKTGLKNALDSPGAKIAKFQTEATRALLKIGEIVGPIVAGVLEFISETFKFVAREIKEVGKVLRIVTLPLQGLGKIIAGIWRIAQPVLKGMADAFNVVLVKTGILRGALVALGSLVAGGLTHIVITFAALMAGPVVASIAAATAASWAFIKTPLGLTLLAIGAAAGLAATHMDDIISFMSGVSKETMEAGDAAVQFTKDSNAAYDKWRRGIALTETEMQNLKSALDEQVKSGQTSAQVAKTLSDEYDRVQTKVKALSDAQKALAESIKASDEAFEKAQRDLSNFQITDINSLLAQQAKGLLGSEEVKQHQLELEAQHSADMLNLLADREEQVRDQISELNRQLAQSLPEKQREDNLKLLEKQEKNLAKLETDVLKAEGTLLKRQIGRTQSIAKQQIKIIDGHLKDTQQLLKVGNTLIETEIQDSLNQRLITEEEAARQRLSIKQSAIEAEIQAEREKLAALEALESTDDIDTLKTREQAYIQASDRLVELQKNLSANTAALMKAEHAQVEKQLQDFRAMIDTTIADVNLAQQERLIKLESRFNALYRRTEADQEAHNDRILAGDLHRIDQQLEAEQRYLDELQSLPLPDDPQKAQERHRAIRETMQRTNDLTLDLIRKETEQQDALHEKILRQLQHEQQVAESTIQRQLDLRGELTKIEETQESLSSSRRALLESENNLAKTRLEIKLKQQEAEGDESGALESKKRLLSLEEQQLRLKQAQAREDLNREELAAQSARGRLQIEQQLTLLKAKQAVIDAKQSGRPELIADAEKQVQFSEDIIARSERLEKLSAQQFADRREALANNQDAELLQFRTRANETLGRRLNDQRSLVPARSKELHELAENRRRDLAEQRRARQDFQAKIRGDAPDTIPLRLQRLLNRERKQVNQQLTPTPIDQFQAQQDHLLEQIRNNQPLSLSPHTPDLQPIAHGLDGIQTAMVGQLQGVTHLLQQIHGQLNQQPESPPAIDLRPQLLELADKIGEKISRVGGINPYSMANLV